MSFQQPSFIPDLIMTLVVLSIGLFSIKYCVPFGIIIILLSLFSLVSIFYEGN